MSRRPSILIIGAGLSGLVLAQALKAHAEITVMEKARGVGGRMSTRYADPFFFDHGAQFFTAKTAEFQSFLRPFLKEEIVQQWQPRIVTMERGMPVVEEAWEMPHYVAQPGMNALCKMLAEDVTLYKAHHITSLKTGDDRRWRVTLKDQEHWPKSYDWVLCTAPPPQAVALLGQDFGGYQALKSVRMEGCFSVMIGLEALHNLPWQAARVKDSPIGWMAMNHTKPERPGMGTSILLQSSMDWAEHHMEDNPDQLLAMLLDEFTALTGIDVSAASYATLHRWRYAGVGKPLGKPYLLDVSRRLAACGDWCLEGRVEAAFTSATKLAAALKEQE